MIIKVSLWRNPVPAEICAVPFLAAALLSMDSTAYAYTPGVIAAKAEPIIAMIRELADPCAYGVFIWACVRFILNQRPEAKEMMKSAAWGYFLVQMAPTFMGMIKDIR